MALTDIRIVLVQTTHPGNIGGVARAMKNMALEALYLVAPRDFPHEQATARAAGAEDLLVSARLCSSLDEALAGCRMVVGTTARARTIGWPQVSPRRAAAQLVAAAQSAPAALVFGRERHGLSNEQVDRCDTLARIPTNARYASLNLVCAVQILAYELLLAGGGSADDPKAAAAPAEASRLRGFYEHLEGTLDQVGFLNAANRQTLMRRLVRLFNRARPSDEEVNILRGILKAVGRAGKVD